MKPDNKRVPQPDPPVARILPSHLQANALNVVVFGPGKGEGIVVVLPEGTVGIVDGCREPVHVKTGRGDPVREFLEALKAERGGTLRLGFVALTHPHDDHYGGLGRLLSAYRGQIDRVWCAPEVGDRYGPALREYVRQTKGGRDLLPDDVKGRGLLRLLAGLRNAYRRHRAKFRYIQEGKHLLEMEVASQPLSIRGCGPMDQDTQMAHDILAKEIDALARGTENPTQIDPNFISGALLIRWGKAGVLLGGDLLCQRGEYCGWHGLADDIQGPIQVIKVAHHASREAHHEQLWDRLQARLAIVTPFKHAEREMPPRPEQIAELAKSCVVAITAHPKWKTARDNPRPLYASGKGAFKRSKGAPLSRNTALPVKTTSGHNDIHNAVAVSLDAEGRLLRFVLAGKADIYDRNAP